MKKLLIIFFLFTIKLSFSQEMLNYQINIFTNGGMSSSKMSIDILREQDSIKIYYTRRVDLDSTLFERDRKKNMRLLKKIQKLKDLDIKKKKQEEFALNFEKYNVYQKDSLSFIVSDNYGYISLIDSIYSVDQETLENKEFTKNWIIIDGIHFSIQVNANNETIKSIWVHSPRIKSHPLIFRLIRNTLDLYREKNPNSFLKKEYTSNY